MQFTNDPDYIAQTKSIRFWKVRIIDSTVYLVIWLVLTEIFNLWYRRLKESKCL
jgi:hypothetical protein